MTLTRRSTFLYHLRTQLSAHKRTSQTLLIFQRTQRNHQK